jgi:GNAT superfamily N-acetyltransferase
MIRAATPSDRDAVVRFNLALARETEERELSESTLRTGVQAFLEHPEYGCYYLAFEDPVEPRGERDPEPAADDKPIGQIMLTFEFSDWRNGPIWWIQSVYVEPAHRRRGIYRALHAHVRGAAREAGAVGLRLYVDRENRVAKATYRSLGMEPSRYDMYEEIWG